MTTTILNDKVLTKCRRCGGVVVKDLQDDSICLMCGERYYFEEITLDVPEPYEDTRRIHHHFPKIPQSVLNKEQTDRWRRQGLCPGCGKERDVFNRLSCSVCLARYQRNNLKRKVAKEKLKRIEMK